LGSGGEFDFLLPYQQEIIICGVPTISLPHHIQIPVQKNSIQGLLYVVVEHFSLFFYLSIKRLLLRHFPGILFTFSQRLCFGVFLFYLFSDTVWYQKSFKKKQG
jgi:hypothetical protein